MTSYGLERDERIRLAALQRCEELRRRWGDHVPAKELKELEFEGERVLMLGPGMGIFKPKELTDGPLTVRTSLDSPYADAVLHGGQAIEYDFAPPAREYDNRGLEELARLRRPLIYLLQVSPKSRGSEFAIVAPVYVASWDDRQRTFRIALGTPMAAAEQVQEQGPTIEREYRFIELRARLHQARFRRVVLAAYRQRCAICELRVRPLLDAAHIVPDSEGGEPHLSNAVGLCVLHHRALDRRVIRISPDYRVRVDPGRIHDDDRAGQAGLMAHDGSHLTLPRARGSWPAPELLERAFGQ